MPLDLLAVGLTTIDITVHPVASLPEGETGEIVEKIVLSPAGTAGGTIFVAQRLGLSTAIASAVGDDPQGQLIRSMFDAAGVDTSLLAVDPGWPTSTTVLPVRPNGDRPNWHMMGASIFAPVTDAVFAALGRTAAVHWAGVGFPGAAGKGADLLRQARARGVFTSCDLIAPSDAAGADLATLLPHVDLFMPSLAEVRVLAGTDDPVEGARRFMARGAGGCLIKMGGEGALLVLPGRQVHAPAHRIDPVDTTSCGDSLCAGYIAGRARGLDPADALRFGVATAAQVALGVGTLGTLESYDATLAFMRDTPVREEAR
ncbi:sugar/nucleoside kinase (ribokinase family) [Sphingopyxis panaciterrae]|uniref:carbohydrate kinase family protein n=1 Tax=Sphingopyxis panaciterrae TaxID=363841 RepID=UPI0014207618|nr:sugar kinase [Sphingopyxis panaciterrae]NIJ39703.1 sugar/nucleoside kinase (ribokinase family) [Sphingopyxis panaciterrae]